MAKVHIVFWAGLSMIVLGALLGTVQVLWPRSARGSALFFNRFLGQNTLRADVNAVVLAMILIGGLIMVAALIALLVIWQ